MSLKIKDVIESGTAASIVSPHFGKSEGTRRTCRVSFEGFDDRAHYVAALLQKPGFFASFYYKPITVTDTEDHKIEIWVNEKSFKKRFDTVSHKLPNLLQEFFGFDVPKKEPKRMEQALPPQPANPLAPAHPLQADPLNALDIRQARQEAHDQNKPIYLGHNSSGLPMILTPQGAVYIHCRLEEFLDLESGAIVEGAELMQQDQRLAPLCRRLLQSEFQRTQVHNEQLLQGQAARLLPILQGLSPAAAQATQDDVHQMLLQAHTLRSYNDRFVFRPNKQGFKRPLLVTPETTYILLNSKKDILIGEGSFKTVRFAIDAATGKICVVAINKGSADEPKNRDLLNNEAEMMRRLVGQRGAVQLLEDVRSGSKRYFIMEYCNRGDLATAIEKNALTDAQKHQIALDIAEIVRTLHKLGIMYRDLKPENILLYEDENGNLRAKLCDFGLAVDLRNRRMLRQVSGTPEHLSPELWTVAQRVAKLARETLAASKKGRHASHKFKVAHAQEGAEILRDTEAASQQANDIWGLGTVYYLLFHRLGRNYEARLEELTKAQRGQQDPAQMLQNSHIDVRTQAIVRRMLIVSPAQRVMTAADVYQELLVM